MQIAACSASMVKSMKKNKQFERAVHGLFLILGLVTVASVLVITVYLVISGIPAILEIGNKAQDQEESVYSPLKLFVLIHTFHH